MHLPPMLVSYRPSRDLILAMVAPEHENELALWTSLSALADALNSLLQYVRQVPSPPCERRLFVCCAMSCP